MIRLLLILWAAFRAHPTAFLETGIAISVGLSVGNAMMAALTISGEWNLSGGWERSITQSVRTAIGYPALVVARGESYTAKWFYSTEQGRAFRNSYIFYNGEIALWYQGGQGWHCGSWEKVSGTCNVKIASDINAQSVTNMRTECPKQIINCDMEP